MDEVIVSAKSRVHHLVPGIDGVANAGWSLCRRRLSLGDEFGPGRRSQGITQLLKKKGLAGRIRTARMGVSVEKMRA
jgi:hypothetical protein